MNVQFKSMLMNTIEMRSEVDSFLDKIDENFLKVVHAMLETYVKQQEDPIIGYDIEGNPKRASVMKKTYDEQVKNAIEKGEFITIEDLEKEMETW